MNRFFLVALLIVAAGCSSTPKKDAPTPAASTAAATSAPAPGAATQTAPAAASSKDKAKGKKAAGTAKADAATVPGLLTCASASDKRTIEVKARASSGCEVLYTKAGNTQSVATSNNGSDYCKKTVEKIQGKLEQAGFSCQ